MMKSHHFTCHSWIFKAKTFSFVDSSELLFHNEVKDITNFLATGQNAPYPTSPTISLCPAMF